MNKFLSGLALCVVFPLLSVFVLATVPARNPLIWADVPDNAIVRVGDTYYMSSTTMHMSPGVPIMKSKHFMGYRFGLFNFATKKTDGYVDFDFFRPDYHIIAKPPAR
jgi:beta-xylosidase